jgi:hypothetical protein
VRCEVVYGTDGVESLMGWGSRSCMEQMVSNRVWGEMRGRVCNRWCQILHGVARSGMEQMVSNRVYGMRCEVVYGPDGVKSCMG